MFHVFNISCTLLGAGGLYATTKHKAIKTVNQNLATENRVKYKRSVVFGITPKLGRVFSEKTLGYAKLGIEFSKDTAIYVNSVSGAKLANGSKTVPAFALGFGLDTVVMIFSTIELSTLICTAARNEDVFLAYRVARPLHLFKCRNAFSTKWRDL